MADEGIREDIHDPEVEHDPNTLHDLGAERDENERFQTYAQTRLYPPGHIRLNTHQAFAETMEQPPVSIKTGFQSTASTGHVLFAANGPDIHSFDILENKHLSTWKWPKEKNFPEIPEALTSVHDPNLPGWALQVDETIELKPAKKSGKKSGKKETGKTAAGKTDAGDKDAANAGKSAKRRKLNNTEPELTVLDGETEVEKPDENGTDVNTKDGFAGDLDTEELDPVPARPTNPATWHSGIVKGDADNSGENSDGTDIKNTKYEKTSTRPPDEKPEGWTPDQLENWRRPEFRPERRLLWKHQASTATPDIPMVQCMSVTADGKHVVAVTGSDKTIWVFEHDGNGKLTLLSQRTMPKRPNAIAFANKDRTILCADKFGDVYALPTIECNDVPIRATPALLSRSATPAVTRSFHSQANEKTVHSKRNLAALENQKKQLEKEGSSTPRNGINPKKDPTGDFYHKLVLGHVSMLTDLTVGRIQTTDPKSGKTSIKELIITADRDEHIRVSRGMPQSHVIENFLLGHKEFVSRVHIPQRYPNILISGGGDTSVYIWDYVTGHLLSKQDMRQAMVKPLDIDTEAEPALAVSGITSYYDSAINQTRVFVICENNPNIFSFHLGDNEAAEEGPSISSPDATAKIPLAANPLSISNFSTEKAQGIIVAFDPMTAGTTAYVHSYPPFVQLIIPTGLSTPPQIEELTVSKEYSEDIALTFRGEWERALYGIEPLRKNCFDRDSSVKEEGGNGDVKASTG